MKYKHMILYPWMNHEIGAVEYRDTGFYLASEVNEALGIPTDSVVAETNEAIRKLKNAPTCPQILAAENEGMP